MQAPDRPGAGDYGQQRHLVDVGTQLVVGPRLLDDPGGVPGSPLSSRRPRTLIVVGVAQDDVARDRTGTEVAGVVPDQVGVRISHVEPDDSLHVPSLRIPRIPRLRNDLSTNPSLASPASSSRIPSQRQGEGGIVKLGRAKGGRVQIGQGSP